MGRTKNLIEDQDLRERMHDLGLNSSKIEKQYGIRHQMTDFLMKNEEKNKEKVFTKDKLEAIFTDLDCEKEVCRIKDILKGKKVSATVKSKQLQNRFTVLIEIEGSEYSIQRNPLTAEYQVLAIAKDAPAIQKLIKELN